MPQIFTDRIILSALYENGVPCVITNLRVETLGGVHIPCQYSNTDFTVQFQEDMQGQCVRIIVTCDNCGTCPPHIIEKCFCKTNTDCTNCSTCGSDGFCKSICPDQFCQGDVCMDCRGPEDCKNGKICSQGKCVCPADKYENEFGRCVDCLNDGQCPTCNKCVGFTCLLKDCLGKLLDPTNCECVDCIDSADCKLKDPNSCCEDGKCKCCSGYIFDPVQNKCVSKPDCGPGSGVETPPCYTCENGVLIPLTCPPGRVRTNDPNNCCKVACDCQNPTCLNQADFCVTPLAGSCYCQNCDKPCNGDNSCDEGCYCNLTNRRCQKNPCDQACDANHPCPNGCGCDPLTNRCRPCSSFTCTQCPGVVGCLCDNTTNNLCGPAPCAGPCTSPIDCKGANCGCNPLLLKCEDCDRPCSSNDDCQWGCYCDQGVKRCKKNPCWKPCSSGKDCDPGCGCNGSKGCYPCSSFTCTQCLAIDGCKCTNGVTCDDGGKTDCLDKFYMKRDDAACSLEAVLETKDCCSCPDIGYYVQMVTTGTDVTISQKLKKGTTVISPDLDLSGILNDYPALSGSVVYEINVIYVNGVTTSLTPPITVDWSYRLPNLFDPVHNILCNNGGNTIARIDVIFKTDLDFEFASGCKYFIPAGTITSVYKCNSGSEVVIPMNKRLGCKLPIITWYKGLALGGLTKFRQVYSTQVSPGVYHDVITNNTGLELCNFFKAETDCGCDKETYYSCYNDELRPTRLNMCNPTDLNVNENQLLCNKEITIAETDVCSLMNGQTYTLYINGVLEGNFVAVGGKLFVGGLTIVKTVPITSLRLVFPCDDCNLCEINKTFLVISPCNCATTPMTLSLVGVPDCSTGFSYQINGGDGPYQVTVVRTIPPVDHEVDTFTHNGAVPVTYSFNGPLENGTWYVKVVDVNGCEKRISFVINCCDLGNPSINYDCATQQIVVNSTGAIATEYELGNSGVWILLNNTKRINAVLANGVYPGYVCLRRQSDHTCQQCFDLTVDCDPCALAIISASLNATCDTVTLTSNPVWDEYSINNNFTWVGGVAPTIPLGAPLTPGGFVTIYVRLAADPTCIRSIVVFCNNCQPINIGAPVITHDCLTGDLGVTGLLNPPVPPFDPACSFELIYNINGVIHTITDSVAFWGNTIISLYNQVFTQALNTVSLRINVICNGKRCALGTVTQNFPTSDDLGNLSYDCTGPTPGLHWTGSSVMVQVKIAGTWTNVLPGQLLANGTYAVRSITAGEFCTIEKFVNVSCLGGPGGGDPCVDFGAYFTVIGDPCGSTVQVQLSASAPYSASTTLRILEGGVSGCVNPNVLWYSGSGLTINPGGTATFTGVPIANRTRVLHYQLIGYPGDGCICDVEIGSCSNGVSCGALSLIGSNLSCSNSFTGPTFKRVTVNNTNAFMVAVYVDSGSGFLFAGTINGNMSATMSQDYPVGTMVSVRLVCFADPLVFSSTQTITLIC